MPLAGKYSAYVESWEAEDPFDSYKEVNDPYEENFVRPRDLAYYKARVRRPTQVGRFRRSEGEIASLFSDLAEEWRESTALESNLERIILDRSYQRIIGLGPEVLPYVLKDLDETHDHWFWALMAIVGDDKAAGQTSVGAAVEAWLAWGKSTGIFYG